MFYQRPHFHTNHQDELTAVFWAPPFEGPLDVAPHLVQPYFEAYNAFKAYIDDPKNKQHHLQFRLKPGELVIFNNRRMLHGREAFQQGEKAGGRHLRGCYLEMDMYLNELHTRQGVGYKEEETEQRMGTSSYR